MVEIWKAAGEIEEDTFEFEERILAQMMFTGKITDISIHIFHITAAEDRRTESLRHIFPLIRICIL